MQENLKDKYGITDDELKKAVEQIKLGNIACSGAVLCALCDLLSSGDIQPPKADNPIVNLLDEINEVQCDLHRIREEEVQKLEKFKANDENTQAYGKQRTKVLFISMAYRNISTARDELVEVG